MRKLRKVFNPVSGMNLKKILRKDIVRLSLHMRFCMQRVSRMMRRSGKTICMNELLDLQERLYFHQNQ